MGEISTFFANSLSLDSLHFTFPNSQLLSNTLKRL